MYRYFWEVEPEKIDVEERAKYVVERILEWGRVEDVKWLIAEYGLPVIKDILTKSRQMPIKQANFWANIWDIPREEVLCIQPEFRQTHRQHWPY